MAERTFIVLKEETKKLTNVERTSDTIVSGKSRFLPRILKIWPLQHYFSHSS
jgi:hypothetical protein